MYDDREDIGGEEEEQEGSTEDAGRDDDGVRVALDDLGRHFQDRPSNAFPTESSTHTLVYGPTSFLDKIRNCAIFMYAALAEGLVLYFYIYKKRPSMASTKGCRFGRRLGHQSSLRPPAF